MREQARKVTASHLSREACLYVRQSTPRQVVENQESTRRQYALRERARALGWPEDQVVVIDSDLGQSGASAADREGFQKLVAEVGMGRVGIVLGLEVSRLARNCADWHRLLEICALTHTLILDEDGLYDPRQFNDRLLLGLKGTMSEAEQHVLRARMQGGMMSKARRGELRISLPVGLVYDPLGRVVRDPDRQVQEVLGHFFETFRQLRSAGATVRRLREQGIRFPRRPRTRPARGELFWVDLTLGMAVQALHNPRYAGAFAYGRRRGHRRPDGTFTMVAVPQEEWLVLLPDAHEGYLSWEQYLENRRCLRENSEPSRGGRPYRPREGPALLQGIALCGVCGSGMSPRYYTYSGGGTYPYYFCNTRAIRYRAGGCQSIPGRGIDEAVGELLLEMVTPVALEAALAVQSELQSRLEAADRLRRLQVERAQQEVDLARRRYMQVDPDNRLVADTLESDWNIRLRALREAQDEYERQRAADQRLLSEEQEKAIRDLAGDFPRLWRDPAVPHQERKRMVRLLVEDVTLVKTDRIAVHVRFRGGTTRTLELPAPENYWKARKTSPEVVQTIDELLEEHTEGAVARLLNERGLRSGQGLPFRAEMVRDIRHKYGLKTRFERLRERGLLTAQEMAERLAIGTNAVSRRRRMGQLKAHPVGDEDQYLYEDPGPQQPGRKGLTHHEVIQAVDELLEEHTEQEIARILNERGLLSGEGKAFTTKIVAGVRLRQGLLPRRERLRRRGLLTVQEAAQALGVPVQAVPARVAEGRLKAHKVNEKGDRLFEIVALSA